MYLPNNTYRLQLNDHFTLQDLETILPYLHRLGISTIYASPVTTASKGSQHGYDVTNPLTLNPEIGTEAEWQRLTISLERYGIGWIQDIVPNHMAFDMANPWLYDVLQRGRDSAFYGWFDLLNDPLVEPLGQRLMAPFLGAALAECVQKGELTLEFTQQRGFVLRYFNTDFPVAVRLYRRILGVIEGCPDALLASLDPLEAALTAEPVRWKLKVEDWLDQIDGNIAFRGFIAGCCAFVNQRTEVLEPLVQKQHYILTHYGLAAVHINYRRFFTINALIGLCMEKEEVFNYWHGTLHRWARQGRINGLRVDHIDGLADPKAYLQRLRQGFGEDCFIVVEKILHRDETLPADWPVQGTTGYEQLADISQVLTDATGSRNLLTFYRNEIADLADYEELVYQRKHNYLVRNMGGEWENLLNRLLSFPQAIPWDKHRLKRALGVWMACFPTYRAYPDGAGAGDADRLMIATAFDQARRRSPELTAELDLLAAICEPDADPNGPGSSRNQSLCFLRRLMQFTGPLAAKGIEDTVFYVYDPYIAHCEVGDTPALAGIEPAEFHRRMQTRQITQPHSLNATTTHDTKRGEDARIRLNYLSAISREWTDAVRQWRDLNRSLVSETGGRRAPSCNDEYLIYQALLGAWPEDSTVTNAFRTRFANYLTKALREADTETHHTDPDKAYEESCQAFVGAILHRDSPFLQAFTPFAQRVLRDSAVYCLSQLLLKITTPGIPDIYQGTELWETSLVDPDNRRPVDYALRTALLNELRVAEGNSPVTALDLARRHAGKGAMKLYTLYRSLGVRNRLPRVFADGDYLPLDTEGPVLAYLRRHEGDWVLVAVALIREGTEMATPVTIRLPSDTPGRWTDAFTGATFFAASRTLSWPRGFVDWPVILATAR